MSAPDGHTANIHLAAPWVRRGWIVWCAALLLQVLASSAVPNSEAVGDILMFASLLPLSGGILIATIRNESHRFQIEIAPNRVAST